MEPKSLDWNVLEFLKRDVWGGNMEFDLHTHSSQGSICSRMPVWDLVQVANEKGLNGVCITDHDYCYLLCKEKGRVYLNVITIH